MSSHSQLPIHSLRYQWYVGYDRENEYQKNPSWADTLQLSVVEQTDDYRDDTMKLTDTTDDEYMWVTSDTAYNLMRWR